MTEIWQLSTKEHGILLAEGTQRDIRLTIALLIQEHGDIIFEDLDVNAFFRYTDPTRKDQWRLSIDDVEKWYDDAPL
jgi:hypothetical protein